MEVFSDYSSFCKDIQPGVEERISSISKMQCHQDITKQLVSEHEIYDSHITNKKEKLQAYSKLVKYQIQKMQTN